MFRPEVAYASQANRLRETMAAAAITHGETVRADLQRVEVSRKFDLQRPLVFFCQMRDLTVNEIVWPGDGQRLPEDVMLHGLTVEREGVYDIRNALITSNGRIEVTVDGESRVIPVETTPAYRWFGSRLV